MTAKKGPVIHRDKRHAIDLVKSTSAQGNSLSEVLRATVTELRDSKTDCSLYWALEAAQCDRAVEVLLWERLLLFAVEDVGIANPSALTTIRDARHCYFAMDKDDERRYSFLAFAIFSLARSPKNRLAFHSLRELKETMREGLAHMELPGHVK